MRLRFGEKREIKLCTRLMSGFFFFILCFFGIIMREYLFGNIENLIFTCLLVAFGWIGVSTMELVENADFFAEGDRRERFKEVNRNQLIVFIVIIILIYTIIHAVRIG